MNKKRAYIKKISNYAMVGGLGAFLVTGLTGCEQKGAGESDGSVMQATQKQNAFVIIEKTPSGGYTIVDEFPSSKTTIVLRDSSGKERILSQQEIDALVKEESLKIDNGTSRLTSESSSVSSGGMGLGEVLLSSMAGAMLGSYIGNKLFNNQNYQAQRRTNYKSPSAYSKSVNSFKKSASKSSKTISSKKSGFFGSKSRTSSRSRSFFGG